MFAKSKSLSRNAGGLHERQAVSNGGCFRKSSFDWSSVPFRYPATDNKPLPKGRETAPRIQHDFNSGRVPRGPEHSRGPTSPAVFARTGRHTEACLKHDSLQPLSGGFQDQFSGWGATLVDPSNTLDHGFREEFDEAVASWRRLTWKVDRLESQHIRDDDSLPWRTYLLRTDLSKREVLLHKATSSVISSTRHSTPRTACRLTLSILRRPRLAWALRSKDRWCLRLRDSRWR